MALYPWFSSTPNHKIAYDQSYLMACLTWPPPLSTWGFAQSWNKIDDKHIPALIVSPVTKPQLSFGIDAILSDKVGSPRKESVPDLWSTPTKAQHLYEEKNETSNKQQQQSRRKRSWSRAVFSNLQRKGLEKRFQIQKYITKPDRRQLAATLGLTDAQVKVWFQNRRMKWRHSKEKDPEGSTIKSENCLQTAEGSQLTQLNEDN